MENVIVFDKIVKECSKNNKINFDDLKQYNLSEDKFNDLLVYLSSKGIEMFVSNEIEDKIDISEHCDDDSVKQFLKEISKYSLLTPEEEINLLKSYKQGNESARKQLIESNLRLVVSVAKRKNCGRYYSSSSFLDLVQQGTLGLMTAIEKFDVDKGFRLSTYAVWWIDQSIGRYILNDEKTIRIPVSAQEKMKQIKSFQQKFIETNNRVPSIEECAKALKISKEDINTYINASMEVYSLDMPVNDEKDLYLYDIITDDTSIEEIASNKEYYKIILEKLKSILTEKELDIVLRRNGFFDSKKCTLEKVGKKHNLTRERIRQIEVKAYRKARLVLREYNPKRYM